MNTVMISYDLNKPGQNYDELIAAIKALGSWAHILKSCWLVKTNSTPNDVGKVLATFMDKSDRYFINVVQPSPSPMGWLSKECAEWVDKNV